MSVQWSTKISEFVLALTSVLAVWKVHQDSPNWYLHLMSGSVPVYNSPVLVLFGFLSVFFASTLGLLQSGLPEGWCLVESIHKLAVKFASTVGLSSVAIHFCAAYENYVFVLFQLLNLFMVAFSSCILPAKVTKLLILVLQGSAVICIIFVSFSHQNWHGVLGAQLIALAVLSIGTEGNLFNFPSVDGFHYMLACATYLLSQATTFIEL